MTTTVHGLCVFLCHRLGIGTPSLPPVSQAYTNAVSGCVWRTPLSVPCSAGPALWTRRGWSRGRCFSGSRARLPRAPTRIRTTDHCIMAAVGAETRPRRPGPRSVGVCGGAVLRRPPVPPNPRRRVRRPKGRQRHGRGRRRRTSTCHPPWPRPWPSCCRRFVGVKGCVRGRAPLSSRRMAAAPMLSLQPPILCPTPPGGQLPSKPAPPSVTVQGGGCGQRCVDSKHSQTTPATTSTSSIRQLLGAADTQTAHPATFSTVPTRQLLGSANAETTPAGAPAAAADRKQRPDATCEGKNG